MTNDDNERALSGRPTREQVSRSSGNRGPLGDARPDSESNDPTTGAGQKPEEVEDRPNVSIVKPEDYPTEDRKASSPIGSHGKTKP